MDPAIAQLLAQEIQGEPFHGLLARVKRLTRLSRDKMSTLYPQWDRNDEIYRNRRTPDAEDEKAAERKEPIKQVVPLSYAQVQTFVTFCMQVYLQREYFFELIPINADSHPAAQLGMSFLQRDLVKNVWESKLYQFLLDIGRFGVGILKSRWVVEFDEDVELQPGLYGQQIPRLVKKVSFAGNGITNISPYQFFPDPRLPMARFQEGEFVATEEVFARTQLEEWEQNGVIVGTQYVPSITRQMLEGRGQTRVYGLGPTTTRATMTDFKEDNSNVIIVECQLNIVPSKFLVNGEPLGPETKPTRYTVWVANDQRIVKFEPMGYKHKQFTYDLAEYNPDMINFANGSLADSIDLLQDTASWMINARITNVRKVVGDRLVVDPAGVEWSDIVERKPVIRLKTNVSRQGVDKYVQQLPIQDVTVNHIQDAKLLRDMVQETTGINDTLMGELSTGRRSATENRNVTNAAAARVKTLALLIYRNAIETLGRKMLSNLRDGLDVPQVVRLIGPSESLSGLPRFLTADKAMLKGNYEFEVFDGTSPSERMVNAQALQELLTAFFSNPQAALALQIDPHAVLIEWLQLRGIRNPERFKLAVPQQPAQPGAPGQAGGTPGQPGSGGQPPAPDQGGGVPNAGGQSFLPPFEGGGEAGA